MNSKFKNINLADINSIEKPITFAKVVKNNATNNNNSEKNRNNILGNTCRDLIEK